MSRQDEFDLFETLKRETAKIHEKVMGETWAQRVLSSDYTRGVYYELLQKYYGFYLPLKTLLLSLPSALGIIYVLEGATLGGQMMAKQLKISLGLNDREGLMFFNGYGFETAQMWSSFKVQTCDLVRTSKESDVMLEAALETFTALSDWMETP